MKLSQLSGHGKFNKRLIERIGDHNVYLVDEYAIRSSSKTNDDFNSWGINAGFDCVPEGEIWIGDQSRPEEITIFISGALAAIKDVESGKSYDEAYDHAMGVERSIRHKHGAKHMKATGTPPPGIYSSTYLTIPSENLTVYLIDGSVIRDTYKIDYVEGGHHEVYDFVPPGEIWVEDSLSDDEVNNTILHEFVEYVLMRYRNEPYLTAHSLAIRIDFPLRSKIESKSLSNLTKQWALRHVDRLSQ